MDRASSESSPAYPGWRVVAAASGCVFVSFASLLVYTFGVFLKPLASEFHWSREAISAAFGIAALSVAACSPILGILLDRYPPRRIIIPCLIVFGSAFAALSLLQAPIWHLYALFVVLGVVGNGTAQLAFARALSTWFRERRGFAFACLLSGGALGAVVLPSTTQFLIDRSGWRFAFAALGSFSLCFGLPLAFQIRNRPGANRANEPVQGSNIGAALRTYKFWIVVVVLFCASVAQNGAITHLAALLTDRGVRPEGAALAVSALGFATLIGRLLTGFLIDRVFAPRVAFALLITASVGTLLLSRASSLGAGVLASACIGFGMGGEGDVTPYLISRYFGLRSFATLYGLTWTAYAIAGAVGPILMGKVFDLTGSYAVLLVDLTILTAAAAVLMLFLPRFHHAAETPAQLVIAVTNDSIPAS